MDLATGALILSQTVTFIWLVVTELMPFLNISPYNGVVHMVVGMLGSVAAQPKPDGQ